MVRANVSVSQTLLDPAALLARLVFLARVASLATATTAHATQMATVLVLLVGLHHKIRPLNALHVNRDIFSLGILVNRVHPVVNNAILMEIASNVLTDWVFRRIILKSA